MSGTRTHPFVHELVSCPPPDDSIEDALPRVAHSGDRINLAVIIVGALMLGLLTMLFLSEQRARLQQAQTPAPRTQTRVAVAVPPPVPGQPSAPSPPIPAAPPIITPPAPQAEPAPPPRMVEPANDQAQVARWKSPSLILDLSAAANGPAAGNAAAPANAPAIGTATAAAPPALATPITQALTPPASRPPENLSADERFAQRLGVDDAQAMAQATRIRSPSTTMPQGSVISGVLETAINSDLPGFARAVVTREVRSFDGSTLLVPRGSHIIGQYRSGIALGQSRVFVVWTRLIRPDGVSIELASAGTDDLGRGGLEGDVERHFLQRFGGAILLSLMGLGGQAVSPANTQVVINSTQAGAGAAGVALQQEVNISPTIDVPAGTPLRIFVARDLDFSTVESGH